MAVTSMGVGVREVPTLAEDRADGAAQVTKMVAR